MLKSETSSSTSTMTVSSISGTTRSDGASWQSVVVGAGAEIEAKTSAPYPTDWQNRSSSEGASPEMVPYCGTSRAAGSSCCLDRLESESGFHWKRRLGSSRRRQDRSKSTSGERQRRVRTTAERAKRTRLTRLFGCPEGEEQSPPPLYFGSLSFLAGELLVVLIDAVDEVEKLPVLFRDHRLELPDAVLVGENSRRRLMRSQRKTALRSVA